MSQAATTACGAFTAHLGVSEHGHYLHNHAIGDVSQARRSLYTCAGVRCHYVGLKAQPVTFLSSSRTTVVHQQAIICGFASGAGKTLCRATIKTSPAINTRPENFPFTIFILRFFHLTPFSSLVETKSAVVAFWIFSNLLLC